MFPEVRGEREELSNSPQIEAAADGRPLTRYAANSRSNGATRRVWRLGWRTREFGDQGWRARKFGDQGWKSRELRDPGWRAREFGDLAGKARVPLRHKWLSSGRHHAAKSRRLFSNFFLTTPWRVGRRVCHRQAKESYDEEPSAWEGKLPATLARPSRTWRDGRAVDRFVVSRGGRLESPAITGELPEQQPPNSRVPERRDTGQKTAQRTSTATPSDISGSHVTIAVRSSLGSAGASRTSRIRVKPGGTFVCARRKAKWTARQLPGGSQSNGEVLPRKASAWRARLVHPSLRTVTLP